MTRKSFAKGGVMRIKVKSHINHITRTRFWRVSGGGLEPAFFKTFSAAVTSAEWRANRLSVALREVP